jgi:DNA-binding XRE family transcriptional regulator
LQRHSPCSVRSVPSIYADPMVEWLSWSGLFDDPCDLCRRRRWEHDDIGMGHGWTHRVTGPGAELYLQARIRTLERERRGEYDAPLPPPSERRRIREAAGWTQQQVADELHLSRHTVGRYERHAGWSNGRRLVGREPSGEVRLAYSALLRRIEVGERTNFP